MGGSLTEAESRRARDALAQRHALLIAAIAATRPESSRYSTSEIKWVAILNPAKLQAHVDDLSKQIRELNARNSGKRTEEDRDRVNSIDRGPDGEYSGRACHPRHPGQGCGKYTGPVTSAVGSAPCFTSSPLIPHR